MQSNEQYLTQRYHHALMQLKHALNLSHIPVEIPPHVLVVKAVALLKFQFNDLQKMNQSNANPWDDPKYDQFTNSHNSQQRNNKNRNSTIYYHDTRHFYKSHQHKTKSELDSSRFCPSIQTETNNSDLMPPLYFNEDIDCNTMEIDSTLQQQTAEKLGIKCEPRSKTMDATNTNEFSSDWETSGAFSMLEDIDFDIPMDFNSNFM